MKRPMLFAFAALLTGGASSFAAPPAEELFCTTSDGIVRITADKMVVRDLVFTVDAVLQDGVVRLRDTRSDATAVIDSRDEQGLYIEVIEGGISMQVIAPRTSIVSRPSDGHTAPTAPSTGRVEQPNGAPLPSVTSLFR